ncbi:TolC family protein, partial [Acinetobacter baumannii]
VDRYLRAGDPFATRLVDGVAQRFALAPVSADWWHAFGSPALDNVMETAIAANPTLQQAEANLRAAQDLLRAGAGVFYPQVTA